MDHATCNVLYVDRNVREDRYLTASKGDSAAGAEWETELIAENVKLLLHVFGEGSFSYPEFCPRTLPD